MLSTQEAITGGFANPVLDAQTGFKTLMDCMARPARFIALMSVWPNPHHSTEWLRLLR
ncbi:MAG: phosphonate C-P lyase system protein PhnH [Nitratireductor sp.]